MASYRHRIAEGAVKDFPAIKRDYDGYRLMLDARALAGGCIYGERVDGGGASCAGDKYLDRYDDPVMRRLSALMLGIYEPFCALSPECEKILEAAFKKLNMTARASTRVLKVARTIADLEGCGDIQVRHITEAVQYRSLDRKYWE